MGAMAKKAKDDAPNPNGVPNQDIIQRLSFLYQASVYLNTPSSQPHIPTTRRPRKNRMTSNDLARSYISSMKIISQKTTVKIDPAVKRTICKGCNAILIPGSTTSVRVKKSTSHGNSMVYTCNNCKTPRRIPAPPTASIDVEPSETLTPYTSSSRPPIIPTDNSTTDVGSTSMSRHRKHKSGARHTQPLSARNAGHIVFCGNQKLNLGQDNGIYIA